MNFLLPMKATRKPRTMAENDVGNQCLAQRRTTAKEGLTLPNHGSEIVSQVFHPSPGFQSLNLNWQPILCMHPGLLCYHRRSPLRQWFPPSVVSASHTCKLNSTPSGGFRRRSESTKGSGTKGANEAAQHHRLSHIKGAV